MVRVGAYSVCRLAQYCLTIAKMTICFHILSRSEFGALKLTHMQQTVKFDDRKKITETFERFIDLS